MLHFLSKLGFMVIAVCFGLSAITVEPVRANPGRKAEDVEAAIVFNILRFATLPGDSAQVLCVLPGTALSSSLLAIDSKAAGRQAVIIKEVMAETTAADIAANCGALFVPAEDAAYYAKTGVLTISKAPDFTKQGGVVRLFTFGRQTRFEINIGAAQKAQVSFSSKLLRLARIYRGD